METFTVKKNDYSFIPFKLERIDIVQLSNDLSNDTIIRGSVKVNIDIDQTFTENEKNSINSFISDGNIEFKFRHYEKSSDVLVKSFYTSDIYNNIDIKDQELKFGYWSIEPIQNIGYLIEGDNIVHELKEGGVVEFTIYIKNVKQPTNAGTIEIKINLPAETNIIKDNVGYKILLYRELNDEIAIESSNVYYGNQTISNIESGYYVSIVPEASAEYESNNIVPRQKLEKDGYITFDLNLENPSTGVILVTYNSYNGLEANAKFKFVLYDKVDGVDAIFTSETHTTYEGDTFTLPVGYYDIVYETIEGYNVSVEKQRLKLEKDNLIEFIVDIVKI